MEVYQVIHFILNNNKMIDFNSDLFTIKQILVVDYQAMDYQGYQALGYQDYQALLV